MTIAFKDFGRVAAATNQPFSIFPATTLLADINAWIDANNIDVVSCETLISSVDDMVREGIRIWYHESKKT